MSFPFHGTFLLVFSAEFDLVHSFLLKFLWLHLHGTTVSWSAFYLSCNPFVVCTFCSPPQSLLTLKILPFSTGPCSWSSSLLPLPTISDISAILTASIHQCILMMQLYVANSDISSVFAVQIWCPPPYSNSKLNTRPSPVLEPSPRSILPFFLNDVNTNQILRICFQVWPSA